MLRRAPQSIILAAKYSRTARRSEIQVKRGDEPGTIFREPQQLCEDLEKLYIMRLMRSRLAAISPERTQHLDLSGMIFHDDHQRRQRKAEAAD